MKNYYEILEVNPKASGEIIEKAYRVLIKKYHPDLYSGEERKYAEKKLKEINEAYRVLSAEFLREQYDSELEKQIEQEQFDRYNRYYNNSRSTNSRNYNDQEYDDYEEDGDENDEEDDYQPKRKRRGRKKEDKNRNNVGTFMGIVDIVRQLFKNRPSTKGLKNLGRKDFIAGGITLVIVLIIVLVLWFVPESRDWINSLFIAL